LPGYDLTEEMERASVRQMFADPSLLPRLARHLHPERFRLPFSQTIARLALGFYKRHKAVPNRVSILQEVQALRTSGQPVSVEDFATFLEDCADADPVPTKYVLERILAVERHEAMYAAIEQSHVALRGRDYDGVKRAIDEAHLVGRVDFSPGSDFRETLAARTERRRTQGPVHRWGTGITELDELIRGLAAGELGCVIGASKGGKSQLLGLIAMYVMSLGAHCLYISTEMSEQELLDRQDSAIARVPVQDLHLYADVVQEKVIAWTTRLKGGMRVKKVAKRTTTSEIESYLQQVRLEESVEFDVVVVDYADEMDANDRDRYQVRHEELVGVHTDLKDLAERWKLRIWTAGQVKLTEALEKKNPTLADVAGATGKSYIDDIIIAVCRTPEEKVDGFVRFFVAGSRFCQDGVQTDSLPSAFGLGRIVASIPWLDDLDSLGGVEAEVVP
jgi:replicative DNA helicase